MKIKQTIKDVKVADEVIIGQMDFELEMSASEMITNMNTMKESIFLLEDIYRLFKEEITNGEAKRIVSSIHEIYMHSNDLSKKEVEDEKAS